MMNLEDATIPTSLNDHSSTNHDSKVFALALVAVQIDGLALKRLSRTLRANIDVVRTAVRQNGHALAWAAPALRACPTTVAMAIQSQPFSYRSAAHTLQHNIDVVMRAVKTDGRVLEFIVPPLRYRRDVVEAAVSQNGMAIRFALDRGDDPTYHSPLDAALVEMAVRSNGYALASLPAQWRADRSTVLSAVHQAGQALEFAHPTLQADRDIAMTAVAQNGYALGWVGPSLQQSCRDIVYMAVKQTGSALWLAVDVWKSDMSIVTTALRQGKFPLQHVHSSIRNHPSVWAAWVRGTYFLTRDLDRVLECWQNNIGGINW